MLHSKTNLSSQTGASKLFCIGFSLFWGRCRTWCSGFLTIYIKEWVSLWVSDNATFVQVIKYKYININSKHPWLFPVLVCSCSQRLLTHVTTHCLCRATAHAHSNARRQWLEIVSLPQKGLLHKYTSHNNKTIQQSRAAKQIKCHIES